MAAPPKQVGKTISAIRRSIKLKSSDIYRKSTRPAFWAKCGRRPFVISIGPELRSVAYDIPTVRKPTLFASVLAWRKATSDRDHTNNAVTPQAQLKNA